VQGGAAIYASRWPERLKPGHFDYMFNSHQLFHLAVVVAAFVHYHAVLVRCGQRPYPCTRKPVLFCHLRISCRSHWRT